MVLWDGQGKTDQYRSSQLLLRLATHLSCIDGTDGNLGRLRDVHDTRRRSEIGNETVGDVAKDGVTAALVGRGSHW